MNILLTLLKGLLGMKFGWVILLAVGLVFGLSLIKNIISGSFSIGKFFSGFNFFAGGVQGKLIYFAVLAILGYGLLHQLTKATTEYNTDYRNNIHHNQDVFIDERMGSGGCAVNLFYGLIRIGCNQIPMNKVVNNQISKIKPIIINKSNIIPKKIK